MAIYFGLNSPINAQKLLQQIQNLINKYENKDGFLKIEIVNISYEHNYIPLLEQKEIIYDSSTTS